MTVVPRLDRAGPDGRRVKGSARSAWPDRWPPVKPSRILINHLSTIITVDSGPRFRARARAATVAPRGRPPDSARVSPSYPVVGAMPAARLRRRPRGGDPLLRDAVHPGPAAQRGAG